VRVARLDEIEPTPVAGVNWRPLRSTLGIRAFGINAYTAEAGEHVVEPHDESGGGAGRHEELYVVLAGRATFTCGGEAVEASAGTCVFIDDPAERREAVAEEPGTTVLAIGGRVGEPYVVSPWEYYFGGYRLRLQGQPSEELALLDEGLERYPEHGSMLYAKACALAVAGERDEALGFLSRAIARDERARAWAAGDEDFASLRDDPRFPR
jgi:mannose-6-phosphate isomerase-like protein (cupin superfamily)